MQPSKHLSEQNTFDYSLQFHQIYKRQREREREKRGSEKETYTNTNIQFDVVAGYSYMKAFRTLIGACFSRWSAEQSTCRNETCSIFFICQLSPIHCTGLGCVTAKCWVGWDALIQIISEQHWVHESCDELWDRTCHNHAEFEIASALSHSGISSRLLRNQGFGRMFVFFTNLWVIGTTRLQAAFILLGSLNVPPLSCVILLFATHLDSAFACWLWHTAPGWNKLFNLDKLPWNNDFHMFVCFWKQRTSGNKKNIGHESYRFFTHRHTRSAGASRISRRGRPSLPGLTYWLQSFLQNNQINSELPTNMQQSK